MNLHLLSKSNTNSTINSWLHFYMFVFYDWPFPRVYFAKNVANIIFPFNSSLSFLQLCHHLWGFTKGHDPPQK